jgi:CRISPR type III-B/RAMP module RAMP protein Cmr6
LWPDITNPNYFNKGKTILREDEVNPVPLLHLTISIGTTFRFLIACKANSNYEDILSAFILACIMGLGAKRNIGYGSFEILEVK